MMQYDIIKMLNWIFVRRRAFGGKKGFLISQYLSAVSEAISWLEYARKNAESDCNEFRQAINNAAVCMDNYINTRGSYGSFEAVRHIEPKEGW